MALATKTRITLSHAEDPNIPRSCERRQAFPASLSPKQGNSDFFFQESCTFGFDFIRHSFLCGTYRNVASPCGYISRFLAVLLFICKTNIFKSCFPSFLYDVLRCTETLFFTNLFGRRIIFRIAIFIFSKRRIRRNFQLTPLFFFHLLRCNPMRSRVHNFLLVHNRSICSCTCENMWKYR